ncbi:glycosyltransferase [Alteraurantiacibacter aquimixticola]|uniref:Glycosyltransferase family 2 protein n=1 Tax=Alteraurantiacibacter aquimixticola TaxID=2489173 RepID=A0A4T3F4H2_9SPHN|nr:glycosyltransferase family 2 protein [Alteraurantiacibacter aquimixticola]TIX51234.1 glycosyltransferase family 2 protein [Alteraurantiacibacter aquimixticola]
MTSSQALETIDVCICTYRRPEIAGTLASIAAQDLPDHLRLRVIVADNDSTAARLEEIAACCRSLNLDHIYVHAPEKNISRARNACLDNASADWVAFIDDDETAEEGWLAALAAARPGKNCVFGPTRAIYDPETAPDWMIRGDFHSHSMGPREAAHNGSTCNVMIDRLFVERHGLRFREELGTVGGEDTMFFHDMLDNGASFAFEPKAMVSEPVAPARANLKWLLRRRYRSGQIHFRALQRGTRSRVSIAGSAFIRVAYCALAALFAPNKTGKARNLARGALHAGVLTSAFGASLYEEYA